MALLHSHQKRFVTDDKESKKAEYGEEKLNIDRRLEKTVQKYMAKGKSLQQREMDNAHAHPIEAKESS